MSGTETISLCLEHLSVQSPSPQQLVLKTKLFEKSDKIILFITLWQKIEILEHRRIRYGRSLYDSRSGDCDK